MDNVPDVGEVWRELLGDHSPLVVSRHSDGWRLTAERAGGGVLESEVPDGASALRELRELAAAWLREGVVARPLWRVSHLSEGELVARSLAAFGPGAAGVRELLREGGVPSTAVLAAYTSQGGDLLTVALLVDGLAAR